MDAMIPDGRFWGLAIKVVKILWKGGNLAATVDNMAADAEVIANPQATLVTTAPGGGSRLWTRH